MKNPKNRVFEFMQKMWVLYVFICFNMCWSRILGPYFLILLRSIVIAENRQTVKFHVFWKLWRKIEAGPRKFEGNLGIPIDRSRRDLSIGIRLEPYKKNMWVKSLKNRPKKVKNRKNEIFKLSTFLRFFYENICNLMCWFRKCWSRVLILFRS